MRSITSNRRQIGVNFSGGNAEINVWAPKAESLLLHVEHTGAKIPLNPQEYGYWNLQTTELRPADKYRLEINGNALPDPASLWQPDGVHGSSAAVDTTAFSWSDSGWNNVDLDKYIIYELHAGTFTNSGTFEELRQKLPYLKELGITAIEIMPVAEFPGNRNWGYDGVFPFAVQSSYGGPQGLQQLVNACHQHGLAVILDVVYNHLGPEGNYLPSFGHYFTDKYHTPWGNALNFDDEWCDAVRHYFIENVLMWFRDFHIDALRLDAVHAIKDFSPVHILQQMKIEVDKLMAETGRRHYMIVEMDLNDPRFIKPLNMDGFGMDGQWVDEFHHALRVAAGGETTGYYADFNGLEHLAKSYRDAYVFDGIYSPHRKKTFGAPATGRPGQQFVVFSQNHDQVGNRMLGERTSQLVSFEMQKLMAGAVICSPFIPMLFMGEEYSEPNPFLYFVSHTDRELAIAVREGRKKEFAAFHLEGEAPDPNAIKTFEDSKLQWNLTEQQPHAAMLNFYKTMLNIRKQHPALSCLDRDRVEVTTFNEQNCLALKRWHNDETIITLMNFSNGAQTLALPASKTPWYKIIDSAAESWNGPGETAPQKTTGQVTLQPESVVMYRQAD